jgi:hypothetical protein
MAPRPTERKPPLHYGAFGLALSSSFELPGLRPVPAARGALRLDQCTRAGVERMWSGGDRRPVWTTMIDGRACSVRWGKEGDYLTAYGEEALFLLSADHRRLRCAPVSRPTAAWQRFLLDTVLWLSSLVSGAELLHASAVQGRAGVVAFASHSGGGETSVAAELLRRGANLFTDDVLTFATTEGKLRVHPGPALMNLPRVQGGAHGVGAVLARFGEEDWVAVHRAVSKPDGLAALCLLRRTAGPGLRLRRLPPNILHVLPFALGFPHLRERMRERFTLYGRLVTEVPVYEVTAPVAAAPGTVADLVEPLVFGVAKRDKAA